MTLRDLLRVMIAAALVAAVAPSVHGQPSANAFTPPGLVDGSWCTFLPCVADFAVIGTGPSGSVAAATLARELTDSQIRTVTDGTVYAVEEFYSPTWFWNDTQVIPHYMTDIPLNTHHWSVEGGQVNYISEYWPQCKVKQGCQMFNGGVAQSVSDAYWNEVAALVNDPFFAASNVNEVATWYEHYIGVADPTHRHGTSGNLVMREFPSEPLWYAAVTAAMSALGNCPTEIDTNIGVSGYVGNAARNVDVLPNYAPERQTAYDKVWAPYLNDGTGLHTEVSLATVVKVLFHPFFPNRAIGYSYVKNGVLVSEYVRHEVVLATGNLQDPKLLFVSGVGNKTQLEEFGVPVVYDSPQVGLNVLNELVWTFITVMPFNEPRANGSGIIGTWRSARAIARGDPLADCMLSFIRLGPASPTETLVLINAELLRYDSRGTSTPFNGDYHQEWSTSFNPFTDTQNAVPNTDADVAVEITQRVRSMTAALGGIEVSPGLAALANDPASIKAGLPAIASTNYHHHGALRGQPTPRFPSSQYPTATSLASAQAIAASNGVLDSSFNVIGTKGLRVVSNAFAPVQHDAHASQHTAMRLGALGGLKIAQDYL